MPSDNESLVELLHDDAPKEIAGQSVENITMAASGFINLFNAIASFDGPAVAFSGMLSALCTIGSRLAPEDELTKMLRDTADTLPAIYRRNEERNRKATVELRGELETRKDLN